MAADLNQPPSAAQQRAQYRGLTIPLLMLADDLAVLAPTAAALQRFMAALAAACSRWGLIISAEKTECMLVGGAAATACEGCQLRAERGMLLCGGCCRSWHLRCLQVAAPARGRARGRLAVPHVRRGGRAKGRCVAAPGAGGRAAASLGR